MTTREKIIDKIKKCMALAKSSNEHEAAAALRQAQKLMQAHGISDLDMSAAEATEARAKAGATQRPAGWETYLAGHVADAFGCKLMFTSSWARGGEWAFIGTGIPRGCRVCLQGAAAPGQGRPGGIHQGQAEALQAWHQNPPR